MNPILLQIGNIKIYWYSVLIIIGILTSSVLIEKELIEMLSQQEAAREKLLLTRKNNRE